MKCDVTTFQNFVTMKMPMVDAAKTAQTTLLFDLFTLKATSDGVAGNGAAELEAFKMTQEAAFGADPTVVPHDSGLDVPGTSPACPQDARDAQQAAADLKTELESVLTFNDWLLKQLEPCCADLAAAYDGIRTLEAMRLDDRATTRAALVEALYLLARIRDPGVPDTQAAWEPFLFAAYTPTAPFPAIPLSTLIDLPANCDDPAVTEAWDALNTMLLDLAAADDEIRWLEQMLALARQETKMGLEEEVMMETARNTQLAMDVTECVQDLMLLEGRTGEDLGTYTMEKEGLYDTDLMNMLITLEDSGIRIPVLPADPLPGSVAAKMALENLKAMIETKLTFIKWLESKKAPLCSVLAT